MPQCVSENLCGPAQGAGRDLLVSVCVCVCERERDRERERASEWASWEKWREKEGRTQVME